MFLPSLFLSHELYGIRPRNHRAAYLLQPGWLFIELASWTLEIDWTHAL